MKMVSYRTRLITTMITMPKSGSWMTVFLTYQDGLLVQEDYFWYDQQNDEMDHDEISHYYYTDSQLDSIIVTFWDGSQEKETYEYADGNMVKYSIFDLEDDGSWFEFE